MFAAARFDRAATHAGSARTGSRSKSATGGTELRTCVASRSASSMGSGVGCAPSARLSLNSTAATHSDPDGRAAINITAPRSFGSVRRAGFFNRAPQRALSVGFEFNGTLLAYGQTGSGKTHSMIGDVDDEAGHSP